MTGPGYTPRQERPLTTWDARDHLEQAEWLLGSDGGEERAAVHVQWAQALYLGRITAALEQIGEHASNQEWRAQQPR